MKQLIILFIINVCITYAFAQGHTNTGASSSTVGPYCSYYGYSSGFGTTSASNNSYFGSLSGPATTTGSYNTAIGSSVLYSNSTGGYNIAMGYYALYSNTTGHYNTAIGSYSLAANTGQENTATGFGALYSNTTASSQVANGFEALYYNTTGSSNTSIGHKSMHGNTSGSGNTAVGANTMYNNTTGLYNTAIGNDALYTNHYGLFSTAIGYKALFSNYDGNENTAVGTESLHLNTTGFQNTAVGVNALHDNDNAWANTAVGVNSLFSNTYGINNTSIGLSALSFNTTGHDNTAIGYWAGPNAANYGNTTALGYYAIPTASGQVRVGNANVISIGGQVGWTTFSDGRFKREVKTDVPGLDFINQLRPVSYTVDKDAFEKFLGIPDSVRQANAAVREIPSRQTGFIAQEVEEVMKKNGSVFSGLDAPKNDRDYYGIRYSEFVVPLVKAVQELTAKVEKQQAEIDLLLSTLKKTETDNNKLLPQEETIELLDNTPNPFSVDTEIKMKLPETVNQADLIIYSLDGKQIKSITVATRGNASVKISSYELSAGMYIYALLADGKVIDTKRMVLTK